MNHLQQKPDPLPRVLARQLDQAARQAVVERDDWRQALDLFEQKLPSGVRSEPGPTTIATSCSTRSTTSARYA